MQLVSFKDLVYIKAIMVIIIFCIFFLGRCIECVKASPYLELANELEITKAVTYLKEKDLAKVSIYLKISLLIYSTARVHIGYEMVDSQ